MATDSRHQCMIYDGAPSKQLGVIALIIISKLSEGYRCLYLNSTPMIAGLRSTLSSLGTNVAEEIANGRLILSDEPVSGRDFNSDMLLAQIEDALDQAIADGYKGLWASGDMTWEFGPERNFSKLMEYESELEDLFHKRKELCGICQYHRDSLPEDAMRQGLLSHPHLIINETLSIVNPLYLKYSWPTDIDGHQKIDEMITKLCRQQGIK